MICIEYMLLTAFLCLTSQPPMLCFFCFAGSGPVTPTSKQAAAMMAGTSADMYRYTCPDPVLCARQEQSRQKQLMKQQVG